MAFDALAPQSPINPKADAYGAIALEASRAAALRLRTALDLPYGPDPLQRLDLYLPTDPNVRDVPVLLTLHGGGWTHGYKEWCGFNALPLVDLPCIVASADYRLAGTHRLPAAVDDAADALAWLYRNIALFGGDPNRIFLSGHSAGGHLASMVTLDTKRLAARALPGDVVKACLPVSCSYDLRYVNAQPGSGEHKTLHEVLRHPEDAGAMSPVTLLPGNRTPFYLSWGSEDIDRARLRGSEMVAALTANGNPFEQHVFDTFDHFEIHLAQVQRGNWWVETARRVMAGNGRP